MLCCELCVFTPLLIMDTLKENLTQQGQTPFTLEGWLWILSPWIRNYSVKRTFDSSHIRESKPVLDSGFHAVGSGFQALDSWFFGKWNLDSGFQSLVGPGFLEQYSIFQSPGFQIPRGKKFEESGSPYMGRIVIFSIFYRYSATSCVKPHWLVRKQSKSVQSIMWHSQQNRKRCPNQLLPDYSGVYQNTQPSADLWTAGIYHGITEDHSVVGRVVAWLTHANSPWCYTKTTATGGRDKSSQQ